MVMIHRDRQEASPYSPCLAVPEEKSREYEVMSNRKRKWWLAAILIGCLAPAALADRGHGCGERRSRDCKQVPEGGSAAIYLLGAGLTCFGAMFLRSRVAKSA